MPQPNTADDKEKESSNSKRYSTNRSPTSKSRIGLLLIFLSVIILFGSVSLIYLSANKPDEWTKFWIPTIVNVLLLVVIVIQVFVYAKQWESMNNALEETRNLVAQNERMISASEAQVGAMEGQLEVMRETISENRRIFYVGQRAYISISSINFMRSYHTDRMKPVIKISLVNGGRTPAWEVKIRVTVSIEDSADDRRRDRHLSKAEYTESRLVAHVFIPSQTEPIDIWPDLPFTDDMDKELQGGLSALFVRGEVCFTDISEEEQTLSLCFMWQSEKLAFEDCKQRDNQSESENPN